MKTKSFLLLFFALASVLCNSQDSKNVKRLTLISWYYNISNLTAEGDAYKMQKETLIPYGLGVKLDYGLRKIITYDFGLNLKYGGREVYDGMKYSDSGYSGPVHSVSNSFYLDIPLHINFNLVNTSSVKLSLSTGPLGKMSFYIGHANPDMDGTNRKYRDLGLSGGLEFGLIESFKIFGDLRIFASQYYGHYFVGKYAELESFDLNFGISYKLN